MSKRGLHYMNELTIILVEDDVSTCKRFVEYIDTKDDIVLVSTTNSADQAISDIKYHKPDAMILDLELHHGSGNGLEVLSGLKGISEHPFVVVTTNNSSDITYECARKLGADFILYKHQQDYTEKAVVDFLHSLKDSIKSKKKQDNQEEIDKPEYKNKRIRKYITEELNAVGVNPKAVGFQYLLEAICIVMNEQVTNVCSIVAKKFKKKEESVRRAMQTAINRAWNNADIEILLERYTAVIKSESGCPTITEFVYYYANKAKNNL